MRVRRRVVALLERMAAAHKDDRLVCQVCLEGNDETEEAGGRFVHGGCGCRGSAGFDHLPCLVEAATHNPDRQLDDVPDVPAALHRPRLARAGAGPR